MKDVENALQFHVGTLGFSEDSDYAEESRKIVCQVSLFGFELILNEVDSRTDSHAGHGRVFLGLEHEPAERIRLHFGTHSIRPERVDWGRPTLVVRNLDDNELFFWLPTDDGEH